MKEVEKELTGETNAFHRNEDVAGILAAHTSFFKSSGLIDKVIILFLSIYLIYLFLSINPSGLIDEVSIYVSVCLSIPLSRCNISLALFGWP